MENTGRKAARARSARKSVFSPSEKYKRIYPQYKNKILEWIGKHKPEYAFIGNAMDDNLRSKLLAAQMAPQTYRRILMNETIMTLDELHIVAKIIGAPYKDLI